MTKQWVEKYNHHYLPKGFENHPNWGKTIILMVVEAQGYVIPIQCLFWANDENEKQWGAKSEK